MRASVAGTSKTKRPNRRNPLATLDRVQRDRAWLAFPVGVWKKFGDDRGSDLAVVVTYFTFFSVFPLLLAFVTVLDRVLQSHPDLRHRIVDSALADLPVIGDQLKSSLGAVHGSAVALVVGLVGLVWAGTGAVLALERAMNIAWDVPVAKWPGFVPSRLRALGMLGVIGLAVLATTALAGLGTAMSGLGVAARAGTFMAGMALNIGVFAVAFRILPARDFRWGEVLPGAAFAGVCWAILQAVGAYVVETKVRGATQVYGSLAVVIGLLGWFMLQAQVTVLAVEVNVVRCKRLWPRSLTAPAGPPPAP